MIKLNSDLTHGLDIFKQKVLANEQDQSKLAGASKISSDAIEIATNESQSFTFFYRSVHKRVEQHLEIKPSKLEQEANEQKLAEQNERADVAANNILKFIEHQLKQDQQDGATLEQLTSRIDAALEGFNLGYDEATTTLSDLELMTGDLESEIELTQQKVFAGIEQLKQDYLGVTQEPEQVEIADSNVQATNETASVQSQQASINNEFSFELTTADGDRVTINVAALYAQSQQSASYSGVIDGKQVALNFLSEQQTQESQFSFSVEGELDEAELKAINGLLNKVNELAVDFYSGDVNTAFNKALELNYDSQEISEFSISMTQIKNYTAYQAYQTDKPIFNANLANQLKPLADFARDLMQLEQDVEDIFAHPRDLITDVMKQITELRTPISYPQTQPSFAEFADTLLDQFTAHQQV